MKALQIVKRNRGMTDVERGFALDNEIHKKDAAFAAAEILADPSDPRQVEFFTDLHADPHPIASLDDLKAAIRSTYR